MTKQVYITLHGNYQMTTFSVECLPTYSLKRKYKQAINKPQIIKLIMIITTIITNARHNAPLGGECQTWINVCLAKRS